MADGIVTVVTITTVYEVDSSAYRDDVLLGEKSIYDVGDLTDTRVEVSK